MGIRVVTKTQFLCLQEKPIGTGYVPFTYLYLNEKKGKSDSSIIQVVQCTYLMHIILKQKRSDAKCNNFPTHISISEKY